ncbi:MAG: hypothetical protein WCL50_01605 [Spirochaetota bacterium]
MRCVDFLESYDGLEPGTKLPWLLRRHFNSCASCRFEVERLEMAMQVLKAEAFVLDREGDKVIQLEDRVMAAVRLTQRPRRLIGLDTWAIAGLLLAFSGVLMPFARGYGGLGTPIGDDLLFPLALVLGTLLAIFGFLFIGSHFEELSGMLERHEAARAAQRR